MNFRSKLLFFLILLCTSPRFLVAYNDIATEELKTYLKNYEPFFGDRINALVKIEELILAGADPNACNNNYTPLSLLAEVNMNLDRLIDKLVLYGAIPDPVPTGKQRRPIEVALRHKSEKSALKFLRLGAEYTKLPEHYKKGDWLGPFAHCNSELIGEVNLNRPALDKLLTKAVEERNGNYAVLLLSQIAFKGENYLQAAIRLGYTDALECIFNYFSPSKPPQFDDLNIYDQSLLEISIITRNFRATRILLENGADISCESKSTFIAEEIRKIQRERFHAVVY